MGDEPVARQRVLLGGGHERGGLLVCEELRDRFGAWWDVAVQDRVAAGSVGPVPLDQPLEEDADRSEPMPLGVLGEQLALLAGLGGEPHLVVLDVASFDVSNDRDVGGGGDPPRELAQRLIGDLDTARRQECGELHQVAAHGGNELRRSTRHVCPLTVRRVRWEPGFRLGLDGDSGGGGHRLISCIAMSSAAASASMRSDARRYSPASQSSERCK